jgi:hypothetical protein
MRRIVATIGSDGRACVIDEADIGPADDKITVHPVFGTTETPPPAVPGGHGKFSDLNVAPGLVRWTIFQWPAGKELGFHRTNTIDFDTVLAGSIDLILDGGTHHLEVGDCVVINGVDHGWRSGPEGCGLSALVLGCLPSA